jgi:hypothetical protein
MKWIKSAKNYIVKRKGIFKHFYVRVAFFFFIIAIIAMIIFLVFNIDFVKYQLDRPLKLRDVVIIGIGYLLFIKE